MEDVIKKEACLATNYFMVFSASNATAALFELALYHSILAFFPQLQKKICVGRPGYKAMPIPLEVKY